MPSFITVRSPFYLLPILFLAGALRADTNAPAKASPKPVDHGDEVNSGLFAYKADATVPLHPPKRPLAKLELKDRIYHGMLINSDNDEIFDRFYKQYVKAVGIKPSMIGTFHARWSRGVEQPESLFLERLQRIDKIPNVVPFVKLYTSDWDGEGPFMKANDILAGKDDAYFQHLATMSKTFGKPFLLSIDHEMNGDWYPYSELFKGNKTGKTDWTAPKFILIWQRIHKIFKDAGVTNVAFAWCPGAQGRAYPPYDAVNSYKAYYPGDAYVDWVGASFYNDVNQYALDTLAASYPNKPIILAEWATDAHRGDWYEPKPYPGDARHMQKTFDMCTKRYPNMKAMTYFYWGDDVDMERVPEQLQIYRREIAKPIFKSSGK